MGGTIHLEIAGGKAGGKEGPATGWTGGEHSPNTVQTLKQEVSFGAWSDTESPPSPPT